MALLPKLIPIYAVGSPEKAYITQIQAQKLHHYQCVLNAIDSNTDVSFNEWLAKAAEYAYQTFRTSCIRSRTNKLPAQFAVDVKNGKRWQN